MTRAMGSFSEKVRSLLVAVLRLEARTVRLRGTHRLALLLYSPFKRENDYVTYVGSYGSGLIQIDTRSFIEWWIYIYGGFEAGAIDLLGTLLQPGAVALDVGANVGVFTLPLARAVGPGGQIHAFEPHPRVRERLSTNLALNNLRNVTVSASAVGAKTGQATLHAASHANQGQASLRPSAGLEESIVCDVTTVDEYVAKTSLRRVDLIKIDIEGAELMALQGAVKTLEAYKPCVYVEVSPDYLAAFGASARDVAVLLHGLGYEIWLNKSVERAWFRKKLELARMDPNESPTTGIDSYWLAVHPGSILRNDATPS